jgi:hypothetical protein
LMAIESAGRPDAVPWQGRNNRFARKAVVGKTLLGPNCHVQ